MSKAKYSNDFKGEVIEKGLLKEIVQTKKRLYHDNKHKEIDEETGVVYCVVDNCDWFNYVIECKQDKERDCALLLLESKKKKVQRIKKKINDLVLSDNAVFITLTFRDDVFEKTSAETRRRYVSRYLKSQGCEYVANIDFSPDISREHYHAVINTRVDLNAWKYGFSYAEKMRCRNSDLARVSKYISKLTMHALKVNATRLIYSRL